MAGGRKTVLPRDRRTGRFEEGGGWQVWWAGCASKGKGRLQGWLQQRTGLVCWRPGCWQEQGLRKDGTGGALCGERVRKADLQHSKASGVTWRVWRPQPYKGKVAEGVCVGSGARATRVWARAAWPESGCRVRPQLLLCQPGTLQLSTSFVVV